MNSGVDDVSFLSDLSSYVRDPSSKWNAPTVFIAGHSNGGMMTNRIWCERPSDFAGFATFSGPPSEVYDPREPSVVCIGSTTSPILSVFGDADTELQVKGHEADHIWTCARTWFAKYAFLDPNVVNDIDFLVEKRAPAACQQKPTGQPTSSTQQADFFDACSGQVGVMKLKGSEHSVDSLQEHLGNSLVTVAFDFFQSAAATSISV